MEEIPKENDEGTANLDTKNVAFKIFLIPFLFWLICVFILYSLGKEEVVFYGSMILFMPLMIGFPIIMTLISVFNKKKLTNKQLFYNALLSFVIFAILLLLVIYN
jgi:hypothetical protein